MIMKKEIEKLYAELQSNNGIVPDSWKPYLTIFKLLLKAAEIFTPDNIDKIIEEIIAAINLFEAA